MEGIKKIYMQNEDGELVEVVNFHRIHLDLLEDKLESIIKNVKELGIEIKRFEEYLDDKSEVNRY
jgi:DNA-binding transcriptional regulator YhcF (GntR family)